MVIKMTSIFLLMCVGLGLAYAVYHRKNKGFWSAAAEAVGHGGVILMTVAIGLFMGCVDGEVLVTWLAIFAILGICIATIVGGIYGSHMMDLRAAIIPSMCWLWAFCLPAAILFCMMGICWLAVGIFFPAFSWGRLSRWAYQD